MVSIDSLSNPLVSVIIPCFNGEAYIRQAVNSALEQTYKNIEVIIVDDGSTDTSYSLLQDYGDRIKLLHHPEHLNKGVSNSRKLGIEQSKGEWIAFLDADDIWEQNKIEYQISNLRFHPEAILCHTKAQVIYEDAKDREKYNYEFSVKEEKYLYHFQEQSSFLELNNICNSSVLVKNAVLQNIPFNFPQLFQFEDWLMWVVLSQAGPFLFLPDATTFYRYHSSSSTSKTLSNELRYHYSYLEMLFCLVSRYDLQDSKIQMIADKFKWSCTQLIQTYNTTVSGSEAKQLTECIIGNREGQIGYLNEKIERYEELLKEKERELRLMKSSRLYKLLIKVNNLRYKLKL